VVPETDDVQIGSIVLFKQGVYKTTEVNGIQRDGGDRWHQGIITDIQIDENGNQVYTGHHTKTEADGKWCSYKDHSYGFTDYTIEHFRVSPKKCAPENSVQSFSSHCLIPTVIALFFFIAIR